jgi:hypothetical protein
MTTAFILRLVSTTAAFGGVRLYPELRAIVGLALPDWRLGEDGWLRSASCAQCPMTMETPTALYVVRSGRTPPVTEFIGALSEAWCRYAPVLLEQLAGAVLRVEPLNHLALAGALTLPGPVAH